MKKIISFVLVLLFAQVGYAQNVQSNAQGKPVQVQGAYNSVAPTAISGQLVPLQTDSSGNLKVNCLTGCSGGGGGGSNAAAGATGSAVPSYSSYTGYQDGSGNSIGVSSSHPLPVTDSGVISAINSAAITPGPALISNATGIGTSSSATPRVTVASDSFPASQAVTGTFYQATQPVSNTQLPATLGQTTAANSLPVVNPAAVTITGPAAQSTVSTDMLTGNATSGASSWTDVSAYRFMSVQIEGGAGIASGNVTIEQTNDTTNALAGHPSVCFSAVGTSGGAFSCSAVSVAANSLASFNVALTERYIRVRINSAFTGGTAQAIAIFSSIGASPLIGTNVVFGSTADGSAPANAPVLVAGKIQTTAAAGVTNGSTATIRMSSDGKQLILPYAPPEQSWGYAAASGGLTNTTTAVTLQAAGAASVRNYLKHCSFAGPAIGAATELIIQDGAAGSVLWRGYEGTSGFVAGLEVEFNPPLRGSAATLIQFNTATASITGTLYVNCEGFQAP